MASGRESWSSRLGFTLAAVGSAVGLGNMWRFSYMTAENGGAAFVMLYVLMTALVGLPVMLAELTLGRGAARSPVQALIHYGGRPWGALGIVFVLAGVAILSYYGVIAGWTVRYGIEALTQGFPADAGDKFGAIATGGAAVAWHLGFLAVTTLVVSGGVRGGIERAALWLMPALGVLVVGLALYAATLEGASAGYAFYFQTDFGALADMDVLKDAAGQAFFSLSLGMGAILTYASYLSRDQDLPAESVTIALSDFAVAFIAGLVVFPLIFALGLQDEVGGSTLGALFITLPKAFASMGTAGTVIGVAFFAALVVGALTSAVSLLEVVVSTLIDQTGMERRTAALVCGGAIALLGVPSALSLDVLGLVDQVGGQLLLILGGLALAIFVGFFMPDPTGEASEGSRFGALLFAWRALLRFVVVPILAVVSVYTLIDTWNALAALVAG